MPKVYLVGEDLRWRRVGDNVKAVLTDVLLDVTKGGKDVIGELHVRISSEGIITDAIVKGKIVATACYPLDDLIGSLGDIRCQKN